MSFRFIIGRAGSGKTHSCVRSIRERLRSDPVDGPRLVFLVPEQAAQQMERAMLDPPSEWDRGGIAASHRAEVVSFQRLALRVLDSVGAPERTALSEPARQMVLRHLVGRRAKELQYYGRVAGVGRTSGRVGGFIERLSATINELIQEAVDPASLDASFGDDAAPDEAGQRAKFHDLSLLYRDYLDYLGSERIDPSQYLAWAQTFLPRCVWLRGAELWIDGFASFSGLEMQSLVALARVCSDTSITLLLDPGFAAAAFTGGSSASPNDGTARRLFGKTLRTLRQVRAAMLEHGIEEDRSVVFAANPPPRFIGAPTIAALERELFRDGASAQSESLGREPIANGPAHTLEEPIPHGRDSESRGRGSEAYGRESVEVVELPTRRLEVEFAVARIVEWVSAPTSPYRYRDIAIIVRDLEPYHDLLHSALDARNIPFFMDRRRPVAHHPVVELLRCLPAIVAEGMSFSSVQTLLKTGLVPLSVDAVDELENYLLAHGIAGKDAWCGADWTFRIRSGFAEEAKEDPSDTQLVERVNQTRREIIGLMNRWLRVHDAAGAPSADSRRVEGEAWRAELLDVLTQLKVESTLERWAADAEESGDLDRAEEHRQVWRDAMSLLDDLASAFSGASLDVEELGDVLAAGLSSFTVGLVPATVDQLLVGSIERSRHPNLKAAIILGFNEGVFPHRHTEDAVFNDDDRTLLLSRGLRIGPPTRERVLDEAMLVYIAATRPSEQLLITFARSDARGRGLRPSPYLRALQEACPELAVRSVEDPTRERSTWDVLTARDLVRRMVEEFRTRPSLESDDATVRGKWNELYARFREQLPAEPSFATARRGLAPARRETLSPNSMQRLLGGTLRTSFSRLESFAACPFQHFARYFLQLKERKEAVVEAVDVGQVHHAVLEEFLGEVARQGRGLGAMNDADLLGQLDASCERVAARLREDSALSDARGAYLLRRSRSDLARVLHAQRFAAARGKLRPLATELSFGMGADGREQKDLEALEIWTPNGRRVLVRGYIDRVDVAEVADELLGVVVDYKRTRDKRLDVSMVYHGLSLQLLGYLIALAQRGETLTGRKLRPIAALYVSSMMKYELVEHPSKAKVSEAGAGTFRPRGMLRQDDLPVLDDVPSGSRSPVYNVAIKKDGDLAHADRSDAAGSANFSDMLAHVEGKVGEFADRILDGAVEVNPYRLGDASPCSWCPMQGVCRFEMGLSDVRFLDRLKRSDVFARVSTRVGPGTPIRSDAMHGSSLKG